MKRIILIGFLALAASIALAQTSVRTPTDVTGVQTGVPCDATLGRALSTTASGAIICTDRVANSNNATSADTAQSAVTAQTATTATTATNALNAVNASNLTGTLDASKITGTLDASQIPAGAGGNAAQVVCVSKSVTVSGSGYAAAYNMSMSMSLSGTMPSLGTAQSTSISISGNVNNMHAQGCANPASGSATVTCNANGSFAVSWSAAGDTRTMGCANGGEGPCTCQSVGSITSSGSGTY